MHSVSTTILSSAQNDGSLNLCKVSMRDSQVFWKHGGVEWSGMEGEMMWKE